MSSIMSYFSTVLPIKEFILGLTKRMASVPELPLPEPCKHCIHQCGHREWLVLSTGVCIGVILCLPFIKPGNINLFSSVYLSGNSKCNLPSANTDANNAADTSQDNEENFHSLATNKTVILLNMYTETCVPSDTCVQPEADAQTEVETSKPSE